MRIDVMVDIETLGTNKDSTIFQIAAATFDVETGEIFEVYEQVADIEKNKTVNVTGSTLKWWLKTNKELLQEILNKGTEASGVILIDFHGWLHKLKLKYQEVCLWGNGILFDNALIQEQLNAMGFDYPIYYKNDRDVRTIVDLATKKLGITEQELKEKFSDTSLVEHNALDDVKYQINLVTYCYNVLIN
jgi:hypothetical protein